MIIDFKARRTTLVASPVDGRSGIPTLTTLAESLLGIPITKGEDYVVFVSRSRKVCKIVFWDERGACMVVRRLNDGRFARFLMRASGPAAAPLRRTNWRRTGIAKICRQNGEECLKIYSNQIDE